MRDVDGDSEWLGSGFGARGKVRFQVRGMGRIGFPLELGSYVMLG